MMMMINFMIMMTMKNVATMIMMMMKMRLSQSKFSKSPHLQEHFSDSGQIGQCLQYDDDHGDDDDLDGDDDDDEDDEDNKSILSKHYYLQVSITLIAAKLEDCLLECDSPLSHCTMMMMMKMMVDDDDDEDDDNGDDDDAGCRMKMELDFELKLTLISSLKVQIRKPD